MIVCMQCIRIDGWRSSPKRQYRSSSDRPRRVCSAIHRETCISCSLMFLLHAPSISTPPVQVPHTMHVRTAPIQSLYPSHRRPTKPRHSPPCHLDRPKRFRAIRNIILRPYIRLYLNLPPPAHTMSRSAVLLFKRISAIARPPVFAVSKAPVRSFSSTIGESLPPTRPGVPVEDNVYLAWHIVHLRRNPTDPSAAAW